MKPNTFKQASHREGTHFYWRAKLEESQRWWIGLKQKVVFNNQTGQAKLRSQTFLTHPHRNCQSLISEKHNGIWTSQATPVGLVLKQLHTRIFFWFMSPISVDCRHSLQVEIDPLHISLQRTGSVLLEEDTSALFIQLTRKLGQTPFPLCFSCLDIV